MYRVLLVADRDEFVRLAKRNVRCWWSVEFMDGKAKQTIHAEAPMGDQGFVVYKVSRFLTPKTLSNLERLYGVRFEGERFEERVLSAGCLLYSRFMNDLREKGLEARPGRYFYSLRPVSV